MDLKERLAKIMREEFGITTDAELIKAFDELEPIDISLFAAPYKGERNAQTA